ncbi:Tryptophan--tRNA ligase, mitochondrial [Cytospora mali]|uniref:Small ribosomal subunit protein uS10m n=1 Tax=Cytospora mali TaxID=578113 RepID=A0A194V5Q6_CYTMA|nr:Tryptophan--tRNA ligase, mitochondrial [Valsa mali var. pyri (nom. inval.)]
MNAPPVLRPLRAILQRRLQLVPSRPIRTPYYIRATQNRLQLRYNSSTPPDQPTKPEPATEASAKDQAPNAQTSESPAETVQEINPETHLEPPERAEAAQGDLKINQAEPTESEIDIPGDVITNFEVPEAAGLRQRLDDIFIKSAFRQVAAASAEVQAGIEEVVARQIEAHEALEASAGAEVAEAVEALADAKILADFAAGYAAGTAEAAVAGEQEVSSPKHDDAFVKAKMQEVEALSLGIQAGLREVEELREAREAAESQESEAIKAAEELRETEEIGVEEVGVSQDEVFTATEAQEIVNEGIAKKIESEEAPAETVQARVNSLASVLEEELEKSKRETLSAVAEAELERRTEDDAAQLVETREEEDDVPEEPSRLPRNVQAFYLQPLRRQAQYGIPSCNLQLRSYSVRPLESFCDFALRAAYYLGLPAFGPTPLPKIIERWTVPKASFIFKKSQENFERITRRRLIQIRDGHPQTVQIWLAFLQKHQQAGVGMKANVWEFSSLDVAKEMDEAYEQAKPLIDDKLRLLGQDKEFATVEKVDEILTTQRYKLAKQRRAATTTTTTTSSNYTANSKVVFSGIQPTGIPHLGNYLGALSQWVRLQNEAAPDTKLLYSVVDLHAITVPQKAAELRAWRREMLAALLAVGLDPERSTISYQSSCPAHSELMWILSCTASMGYLNRMTQWKSKLSLSSDTSALDDRAKSALKLGLFSYPVLQAADILVHRATHVPVGEDQRQHLEFARECATGFNHTYGAAVLVPPETMLSPARRVMSLTDPTKKMSKSDTNPASRILITDEPAHMRKKIMRSLTDLQSDRVTYEPEARPGVSNLLEILSILSGENSTPEETAQGFAGAQHPLKALKERTAEAVVRSMGDIRERYLELLGRDGGRWLDDVEAQGAEKARANAEVTMKLVKEAVGL